MVGHCQSHSALNQDLYSVDAVPLFAPYQGPMIQIYHSNLAVVDLVKRPFERPKNVSLRPNSYRREGVVDRLVTAQ